jgi:predicted Rossmann fold nucleotide-binding protein DprA/Smf involved in DNA uptake
VASTASPTWRRWKPADARSPCSAVAPISSIRPTTPSSPRASWSGGALVTEFPPGTQPEAGNFPARNRLISGLSLGVLVTEAPEQSGALITTRFAAEQGRDVFAVPGNITHRGSVGANRLIQDGAKLVLATEDILTELNLHLVPQQAEMDVRDSRGFVATQGAA